MGAGYWEPRSRDARDVQEHPPVAHRPVTRQGAPDDATWVRTGDYGTYHHDHLYITGRVKDLAIVDGRNHYPQDLEYSAQESSRALRTGYGRPSRADIPVARTRFSSTRTPG